MHGCALTRQVPARPFSHGTAQFLQAEGIATVTWHSSRMADFILERWEQQASTYGLSHEASWGDSHMIALEIAEICDALPDAGRVLDVGCANGYSTEEILKRRPHLDMVGIDFSPEMIRLAQKRATGTDSGVTYETADVRHLPYSDASFDAVYTTRTLINLPNWEEQEAAIRELLRVTRPGGIVLISEAFWEPLCKLNAVREIAGLPPLVEHDFNRYLKLNKVRQLFQSLGVEWTHTGFSSVYYLGTRFLREIATTVEDYEGYSNPLNAVFFELETTYSGGPFSVQALVAARPLG